MLQSAHTHTERNVNEYGSTHAIRLELASELKKIIILNMSVYFAILKQF